MKKRISIQLMDHRSGEVTLETGGKVLVVKAGDAEKLALFDMDGTSLANPVSIVNGHFEFQIDNDAAEAVDLYILAPTGHFVVAQGVAAAGPNEIFIDTAIRRCAMVVPFSIKDMVANTEFNTGFTLPANAVFEPLAPAVRTLTADAGITVDVGTLSTDGGDADGLVPAASVGAVGTVVDRGALLDDAGAPKAFVSDSKAVTITLAAGADTAEGFVSLPYTLVG